LQEFIKTKFQEWLKQGLIDKIASKVNSENQFDVAKAGAISVEDLNAYINGKKDLSYFSIEGIRRYLQI
jgi:tRNA A37 N6-isopentenylltransferase MiaA